MINNDDEAKIAKQGFFAPSSRGKHSQSEDQTLNLLLSISRMSFRSRGYKLSAGSLFKK